MSDALLEIRDLSVQIRAERNHFTVVSELSFSVGEQETLGIVGESGCGKSITASAILGLISPATGRTLAGSSIRFQGEELLGLSNKALCRVRGSRIALILQDSLTVLNPVLTIRRQMVETLRAHQKISKRAALARCVEMLGKVGIPTPEVRINEYPHQLSGGMKQRVNIAIALLCGPKLLIADEPTTALDVSIQAQILELIKEMKAQAGASVILITHDLGVVADMADRILVMYAGELVEYATTRALFKKPLHPYTEGLLRSIPRMDRPSEKLTPIPGAVLSPEEHLEGCKFYPRCPYAMYPREAMCKTEAPPLYEVNGSKVRCWMYRDGGRKEDA
jgi:peptide/nickel transport system ATP-binding protein/oligopeptide transport system ATP-binding protein